MKKPYLPKGCDHQGRHPEAAEAATDLGADDTPQHDMLRVVLGDLAIAAALVGAVLLVLWGVMK